MSSIVATENPVFVVAILRSFRLDLRQHRPLTREPEADLDQPEPEPAARSAARFAVMPRFRHVGGPQQGQLPSRIHIHRVHADLPFPAVNYLYVEKLVYGIVRTEIA